ncbi:MAG: HYR domain-containing protein [Woeseiaceae bacterium]
MSKIRLFRQMTARVGVLIALSLFSLPAFAQGDPGPNTNLIGLTPDPADIRDDKSRQQNEPSCTIRPGNSACIICGYNDYRTIDLFGDGWQGVSMSCDAGYNWTSRIAPGHPEYLPVNARINGAFAADPRMKAIPGMAILNFIAGFRDSNDGVVAVQHWLEVNKEDADHYEPGKFTYIVDTGTSGKFLDKPDMLPVLDPPAQQTPTSLTTEMENPELGNIVREFPSGTLYVAYAAFTGNQESGTQSVKVLVNTSRDWGQTWTNQTLKLSEDQNTVSGISLTAIGETVLATWRRQNDNNDFDSILYSFITQGGKNATKGKVLADICTFDQASSASPLQVTFRTNDFPWAANDGKNFYIFYSDRAFGSDGGDCATGHPRIVMSYANNAGNRSWSGPMAIDDAPTDEFGVSNPESFQFMPTAFGANGKVQVAWYDTRREINLPPDFADTIPGVNLPAAVGDYVSTNGDLVQRKVDVYTTRVTSDSNGTIQPILTPVRVSQYRIAAEVESTLPDGQGGVLDGTLQIEGEASFANKKLYASGSLPFVGDYITMAAEGFRQLPSGKWESNASPVVSPESDKVDFFVAWTSNRDVRGNIANIEDVLPFSPSEEDLTQTTEYTKTTENSGENPIMLADSETPSPETGPPVDRSKTAEGLAGADDAATIEVCTPGVPLDRSRDSNIYGAVIKDQVRLYAPTASKPLSGLQRAFAFVIANTEDVERKYKLEIATQPEPCTASELCRASFRQEPSLPPFNGTPAPDLDEEITVPASSSFMRTVFVVADSEDAQVTVQAFYDDCTEANPDVCAMPIASIVLGGNEDFRNPDFDSLACSGLSAGECDVLRDEFHNPNLINPTLINPNLINPTLINPNLINPNLINPNLINEYLQNPNLINQLLENPNLINYNLENPNLINPNLINPNLINPNLINPNLINPNLINPNLINPTLINTTLNGNDPIEEIDDLTYTDYNFIVQNIGNVTTAYNADVSLENPTNAPIDTQLIAWAPSFTTTTVDCQQQLQVEANVFSTINNPVTDDALKIANIGEPFAGQTSGLARAGESMVFTLRVFGDREDLETLRVSGFTSASQAANCTRQVPSGQSGEWFCSADLGTGIEKIVLDTLPPSLALPPTETVEATGPITTVPFTVTATDLSDPNPVVMCDMDSPLLLAVPAETTVTCFATDSTGNTSEGSFTITVEDTTAPTITAPAPVSEEATAEFTPIADVPLGTPTTFDLVGIALVENDAPATFGVGETTVTWTVTDTSGNTATAGQLVTIVDTTPPTITAPADISQEADSVLNSLALGAATATDAVGVTDISNDADTTYPGGFPVGDNWPVTWTARDAAGNSATDIQFVTITDTTPPVFNVVPGQEFNFEATLPPDPPGSYVDLGSAVTATDLGVPIPVTCTVDGTSPLVVLPAILPAGNYDITCTASDGSTVAISIGIFVNVQDLVAPVLTVPGADVMADADPLTGTAQVTYVVTATDIIDPDPEVICTPASGSTFPIGTTTVTCTASDDGPNALGQPNETTATFDVVVADATPPVFTVVADPYVVAVPDPGTAVVPLAVDFSSNVFATDVVDGLITPFCTPSSGTLFDWGNTPVTCTATDAGGNTSSVTFDVLVEFPYDIDLIVPKGRAEAGSTVKIDWTYSLAGTSQVIDSSAFNVAVFWARYSGNNCTGTPGTMEGSDSGNSDFRYSNADDSWRFNWQTPNMPGSYVVTVSPPRTNDGSNTDSSECVVLK